MQEEQQCPLCVGRGRLIVGGGIIADFMECPYCKGKGKVALAADDCARCCGTGKLVEEDSRAVRTVKHWLEGPCPDCNGTGKHHPSTPE